MKRKELQELKNKPVAELVRLVHDGTEKLRALRFDLAAGKVKNVNELRVLRKNIARMKTFIQEDKSPHLLKGGSVKKISEKTISKKDNIDK